MNFEHLIEINEPGNPLLVPLTRTQLWRGLIIRAEQPELSVMGLERCEILERGADFLRRRLHFGSFRVHDEVRFDELRQVSYDVAATENFPASRLRMVIEEPFPERLFVRFVYEITDVGAPAPDDLVAAHLKQAYVQANNDTVAVIRRLEQEGRLGVQS